MTSSKCLEFLLFLLVQRVSSEEGEPVFRAEGSAIEIGYCFGVDYMAVYRYTPEGYQLLGNSSTDNTPIKLPADLQGRVHIFKHLRLPGLRISHLTHKDSGIYRRECWQNHVLVSRHTEQLYVCDEEVESEEIIVKEEDRRAELLCKSASTGLEGTSVRWYHEKYPSYKLTLFLDSAVSLDPVPAEGVVEVRRGGALIVLDKSVLKNNPHFYCLVVKGKNCLSFQNMYQPDHSEVMDVFASLTDNVILHCSSDGKNQHWETPFGRINSSSAMNNHMHISTGPKAEDFSLVILSVSDEHIGDYSCISPSLEVKYSLVLCPETKSSNKSVFEGGSVSLHCAVGEDDSQRVQWHRLKPSGEEELIHDSKDATVPVPEDLRGRLTPYETNSSLAISDVTMADRGVYWCVVLGGPEFLDDYVDDYDEEDTEEDDFDGEYWHDTHRCILKQETMLAILKTPGRHRSLVTHPSKTEFETFKPAPTNFESIPTAERSAAPDVTPYAVGAGVALLLVVGVVVAVIVIKRRAAASRSGPNTDKDIKMNEDPACTVSLTQNDEYGA